ncbi:MAG: MFS transporter [Dehalococcoidia bacterium]
MPASAADTGPASGGLLRLPAFRWLWCAHLVSMFGDGLYNVALPWLAWEHTHSGIATAVTLATSSFSFLVVGPIAGVCVDRWNRRRTLIGADLSRAATLALLPTVLLWHYSFGVLLLLALAVPAFSRFFTPAQRSTVPSLVRGDQLVAANATMQGAGNAAFIAGPAAAGLLLAISGGVSILFLDGLTFLASAAFLSLVRFPARTEPARSVRVELADGFRITWRIPGLRASALLAIGATICLAPVLSLVPLWLGRSDANGSRTFGLLNSVLFVGSLAGSVLIGRFGRRVPRGAVIAASVAGMGLGIASFGNTHHVMEAALALAVLGACISTYNVGVMTLLQQLSPPGTMGRVFAVNETFSWSLRSVSILVAGAVATWVGVHPTLFVLGMAMLIVGLVAAVVPALREAPRITLVKERA